MTGVRTIQSIIQNRTKGSPRTPGSMRLTKGRAKTSITKGTAPSSRGLNRLVIDNSVPLILLPEKYLFSGFTDKR